ncbi:helix-turn-helix domain-containing protein [Catellatospora bangladeshensis]|uniref:helix-turn-helix domain-containing protein n=1 Tax=Catellatospora bangladeshensis TaxID=310355 RepID=UPI0031F79789
MTTPAIIARPASPRGVAALEKRSVRPAEAAELLGICRDTVYVLMRAGRLRSVKAGRARLIPVTAIEEFLTSEEGMA